MSHLSDYQVTMNINIDHIITQCLIPERNGQRQLYNYTFRHLVTAVALYTGDTSERDWVFNLGMLKVYNSLTNYKRGTNYLGWARTILVRSAIDHIRKNKTYQDHLAPVVVEDDHTIATTANDALSKMETDDLIKVIQSLPENERMIFTMYEIEGYTHVDIEKITSIKKNTSKWLLAKARKALQEKTAHFTNLKENGHG